MNEPYTFTKEKNYFYHNLGTFIENYLVKFETIAIFLGFSGQYEFYQLPKIFQIIFLNNINVFLVRLKAFHSNIVTYFAKTSDRRCYQTRGQTKTWILQRNSQQTAINKNMFTQKFPQKFRSVFMAFCSAWCFKFVLAFLLSVVIVLLSIY